LRLDALLLGGILDVDLFTWEEHSKTLDTFPTLLE
jgi:hypothetical protein